MADERIVRTTVRIGGDVTGQVAVGNNNVLSTVHTGTATASDLAELRAAIADLRSSIEGGPAADQAVTKMDQLDKALTGKQVDMSTVEHVHDWFRRRLPQFAAALNKIILGPVVTKLVAAGGDTLVAEFTRRFG